jgi:hypothetical protein
VVNPLLISQLSDVKPILLWICNCDFKNVIIYAWLLVCSFNCFWHVIVLLPFFFVQIVIKFFNCSNQVLPCSLLSKSLCFDFLSKCNMKLFSYSDKLEGFYKIRLGFEGSESLSFLTMMKCLKSAIFFMEAPWLLFDNTVEWN